LRLIACTFIRPNPALPLKAVARKSPLLDGELCYFVADEAADARRSSHLLLEGYEFGISQTLLLSNLALVLETLLFGQALSLVIPAALLGKFALFLDALLFCETLRLLFLAALLFGELALLFSALLLCETLRCELAFVLEALLFCETLGLFVLAALLLSKLAFVFEAFLFCETLRLFILAALLLSKLAFVFEALLFCETLRCEPAFVIETPLLGKLPRFFILVALLCYPRLFGDPALILNALLLGEALRLLVSPALLVKPSLFGNPRDPVAIRVLKLLPDTDLLRLLLPLDAPFYRLLTCEFRPLLAFGPPLRFPLDELGDANALGVPG
jgi:hypothetical protein